MQDSRIADVDRMGSISNNVKTVSGASDSLKCWDPRRRHAPAPTHLFRIYEV